MGRSGRRSRWWALALLVSTTLAGGAYWLRRPHVIVYRASATECEIEVRHATHDGDAAPVRVRDRWESGAIELVHGDVASVVVTPGPECETVRCELVEDGVVVSRAEGRRGAICSAWTAR
jgi:hypothetical protein